MLILNIADVSTASGADGAVLTIKSVPYLAFVGWPYNDEKAGLSREYRHRLHTCFQTDTGGTSISCSWQRMIIETSIIINHEPGKKTRTLRI